MSDSCDHMDCSLPGILCPWDSPGKDAEVGCHFLLQGIFLTQKSNLGLLHGRQILYPLSYEGSLSFPVTLSISVGQNAQCRIQQEKFLFTECSLEQHCNHFTRINSSIFTPE